MPLKRGRCLLPDLRASRGWTQKELCERIKPYIDVPHASMSKYEREERPMPDLVRKACAIVFDVTMDDIFEYEW